MDGDGGKYGGTSKDGVEDRKGGTLLLLLILFLLYCFNRSESCKTSIEGRPLTDSQVPFHFLFFQIVFVSIMHQLLDFECQIFIYV